MAKQSSKNRELYYKKIADAHLTPNIHTQHKLEPKQCDQRYPKAVSKSMKNPAHFKSLLGNNYTNLRSKNCKLP